MNKPFLDVQSWTTTPKKSMSKILGSRSFGAVEKEICNLMQKVARKSNKTWNRDISQYDTLDLIAEIDQRGSPVRVLDVGCGDGNVLFQLKERYGSHIECHGISVMDHPHSSEINYHICPAEVMPDNWRGYFDIVVTHQAFRYVLFPENALGECVRVTKEGGIFSGYIGTIDDEDRVMYTPPDSLELSASRQANLQRYNELIEEIIAKQEGVEGYDLEYAHGYPHKITLRK